MLSKDRDIYYSISPTPTPPGMLEDEDNTKFAIFTVYIGLYPFV